MVFLRVAALRQTRTRISLAKPTYFFNFEARVDLNAVPEFPCEVLFPLPARPASNRDMPGFGALSKMQLARYRWSCEEPVGIEQMLD
jgi:hypothetical protein